MKKILITGCAGGLAQLCIKSLLKKTNVHIIGIDPRTPKYQHANITYYKEKYSKNSFEHIFSKHKPDTIIHLSRIGHNNTTPIFKKEKLLDLNIISTKQFLDLALQANIKKILLMSSFHVYGAVPDSPSLLTENSPLKASIKHAQLREIVEIDYTFTNWAWKYKDQVNTIVLRPCHIIGKHINNTISQYIKSPIAPSFIDFNPLFQLVHEKDISNIITQCLSNVATGVYNVAPSEFVPLKVIKKVLSPKHLSIPSFSLSIISTLLKTTLTPNILPDYFIDYLKFSSTIDGSLLQKQLPHFSFQYSWKEILQDLKK
ncbi:MAG: NAD-dependent epimerase/dehydratase family protein [Bdellovibrionaceae bacterium]|nr:NAD-dependent epimerase/dehydratase family protein [Pseudobdellovibrionaceae bacterium]